MQRYFWKKTAAGILAVLVLSGAVPVTPLSQFFERTAIAEAAESETLENWIDHKALSLEESEDHETIYISTAEQLALFAYNVNHEVENEKGFYSDRTVELQADIDLSGMNWTPIGSDSTPFTGKFYGNGHKINGSLVQSTNNIALNNVGLFAVVSGATLDGVAITNASVTGKEYCGVLVGKVYGESILTDCSASGTVVASGSYAGGLIGWIGGPANITDCRSDAYVKGNGIVGGFVGYIYAGNVAGNATISGCAARGDVKSVGRDYGGFIGRLAEADAAISDCWCSGAIWGSGGSIGSFIGNYQSGTLQNCSVYPYATGQRAFCGNAASVQGNVLNGSQVAELSKDKDGTPWPEVEQHISDAKEISTAEEFLAIANDLSGCYVLVNDIDFDGSTIEPIGNANTAFTGEFYGQGHRITGFSVESSKRYAGLFGKIAGGRVNGVRAVGEVTGSYTGSSSDVGVGGFAGKIDYKSLVDNCSFYGSVGNNESCNTGGFVGYTADSPCILRCCTNCSVAHNSSNPNTGGFVGNHSGGCITDAYAEAVVESSANYVGGFAGRVSYSARIATSFCSGTVVATDTYLGAFVGQANNNGLITNSFFDTSANGPMEASGTSSLLGSAPYNGITGIDSDSACNPDSFIGFDFDYIWIIEEGYGAPGFRWAIPTYQVTIKDGIKHGTVTADPKGKAAENKIVTLTVTPDEGYVLKSLTVTDIYGYEIAVTNNQFTMPDCDVVISATFVLDSAHFSQDGDTYTIHDAKGWDIFCNCLQDNETYNRFSGKTVCLGADIGTTTNPITRMAGSDGHDFCGTFDGNGNTMYVGINSNTITNDDTQKYVAPFRYVSNADNIPAEIRNLKVAGNVTTNLQSASGLVGCCWGTLNIENCEISTVIDSSVRDDGTHGGIVGIQGDGTLNIKGCVFDGSLLGKSTNSCGGFVGWRRQTANIYNSIFAPTEVTVGNEGSAAFARNHVDTYNCYYTYLLNDGENYISDSANDANHPDKWHNGKAAHTVTAGENVTVGFGTATNTYDVSGITAYGVGLEYDSKFYAGVNDQVTINLGYTGTPETGCAPAFSASAGTLDGNTLTMPDADVVITAAQEQIDYKITLSDDIDNGSVSVMVDGEAVTTAHYNSTVTLIVTPEDRYVLKSLTVMQGNTPIEVSDGTFVMPAADVTINAAFVYGGKCGDDAYWIFDDDTGKLTISGTGAMYNYDYKDAPWFDFSYSINSVEIGSGITAIGDNAFKGCSDLETLTFAENSKLETIGGAAFAECSSLRTIIFAENSTLKTIGSAAFYDCMSLREITIPASVTSIGSSAFCECSELETVHFAENSKLETIESNAFEVCRSLGAICLPASLTSIGEYAFHACSSLYELNFEADSKLKTIGNNAFEASGICFALIPDSVTAIGDHAFYECTGLSSLSLGRNLETIGEYAFYDCNELPSVTLPANLNLIGDHAFEKCWSLDTLNFAKDGKLKTIGEHVFEGCSKITSVTIPASVTSIGEYAFGNYPDLETLIFAENSQLETIGENAFGYCSHLKTLVFAENGKLKTIGKRAFYSCSSLNSLTIPASVTTIDDYAFGYCSNLETLVFAEYSQLETIGSSAFEGCSLLISVTIPASVTLIDSGAFWDCSACTDVYLLVSDPEKLTWNWAFYDFKSGKATKCHVPKGKLAAYNEKFGSTVNVTFVDDLCMLTVADTTNAIVNVIEPKAYYDEGDTISLTVTPDKGYRVKSVTVNGAVLSPADGVYSFEMPADNVTVSAELEKMTEVQINTVDVNGISKAETVYAETYTNADYSVPNAYLDGYTLTGWKINGTEYTTENTANAVVAELVLAGTDVTVEVMYEKKSGKYRVTVTGGKLSTGKTSGEMQVSKLVTVKANTVSGKTFSHWERSGVKVSTNATYSFYMPSEDVELVAVFTDATVDPVGTAIIESVKPDAANQKVSFVSVLSVPKNCKFVKGGLVATNKSNIGENVTAENADYVKLSKGTANTKNLKYTWTKGGMTENTIWYVRAYLVYKDSSGVEHTVYSDVTKANRNGVIADT